MKTENFWRTEKMNRNQMIKEIEEGAYTLLDIGEAFLQYMSDDDCEKLCEKAGFKTQEEEDQIANLKRIAQRGMKND